MAAFIVFIYPFVLVFMCISYLVFFLKENDAEITEAGITVFSRLRGKLATYQWAEIQQIQVCFSPPVTFPVVTLVNGTVINLECVNYQELAAVLQHRGIPVDLEPKFRGA